MGTVRTVSQTLTAEETQALLQETPLAYRTQINDALLTAVALGYRQWSGESILLLDMEGHGRQELSEQLPDVSRTVGWFTSVYPLALELPSGGGMGEALKAVKEQLKDVPSQGIGYGILRYLTRDVELQELFRELPNPEISFNYLGQIEAGAAASGRRFRPAEEPAGWDFAASARRQHLFHLNARITGGRLHFGCQYSINRHHPETAERLLGHITAALRELIAHCQSLMDARRASGFAGIVTVVDDSTEQVLNAIADKINA